MNVGHFAGARVFRGLAPGPRGRRFMRVVRAEAMGPNSWYCQPVTVTPRVLTLTALALTLVTACATLLGLNESLPAADAAAPTADSSVPLDASADASLEAGPRCPQNLLSNPGFEGLDGTWSGATSTSASIETSAARQGTRGMRVCGTRVDAGYLYFVQQALSLEGGMSSYHLRAWLRASPDATSPQPDSNSYLAVDGDGGGLLRGLLPTSVWSCAALSTGPVTAKGVGVGIYAAANESTCIDIDDVALYEVPDSGMLPPGCGCPR
jgi:hypothetical protein